MTVRALKGLIRSLKSVGKEIVKQCQGIFEIQGCLIRIVKILKKPKFDITKLMELHGDSGEDTGLVVNEVKEVEELAGSGGRL